MSSTPAITLYRTAERPDVRMWLRDDTGALLDLSSSYTFELKLGTAGSAATFTKTSGFTGAVGAGIEPTGTPNLVLTFTAADLDAVPVALSAGQIKATTGGKDRFFTFSVLVKDVIT
jgi:hypothetical protein